MIITSDTLLIGHYALFAFVLCTTIVLAFTRSSGKKLMRNYIFLALSVLCWILSIIAYNSFDSFEISKVLYDLELSFVSLTAVAILLFVFRFYNMQAYCTKAVFAILIIVPLITLILSLTANHHNFLRLDLEILSIYPIRTAIALPGSWYYVHSIYSYVIVIAAFFVSIYQQSKLPRNYRGSSKLIILSLGITFIASILAFISIINIRLDISLLGTLISVLLLYFSILKHHDVRTLFMARQNVFNDIRDAIIVLDDSDIIINFNNSASEIFSHYGTGSFKELYEEAWTDISSSISKTEPMRDGQDGLDIYFNDGKIYSCIKKATTNKRGRVIGSIVVFCDVTENREILEKLELQAGVDAMTGLLNLRKIKEHIHLLEADKALPISVIIGDVNYLKAVNDNLGHQQGDVLLRIVSETFSSVCPPNSYIARTGGDEFMIVLPKFDLKMSQDLIVDIKNAAKLIQDQSFVVSISLGAAEKDRLDIDFEEVIRTADKRMYEDKKICHMEDASTIIKK